MCDRATLCSCYEATALSESVWTVVQVPHLGQTGAAVGGHLACCKRRAGKDPGGSGGPGTGF
jgi:hypothetical protein